MFDVLRDPLWQFIGVIFAVLAIFITLVLYRRQRSRKALSYEIVSRTPLLSIREEVKKKLQILFNGNPVQQVHLILVKIINSGNIPILETDFERPIRLIFGHEAQILTTEVVQTRPHSLHVSVKIEDKNVMILPTLLNQGDEIELKMLVSKFNAIEVDGRIVGVKNIEKVSESVYPVILGLTSMILILIGLVGSILEMISGRWPISTYLLIFIAGYVFLGLTYLTSKTLRREVVGRIKG